jgi:hypothetical protein
MESKLFMNEIMIVRDMGNVLFVHLLSSTIGAYKSD